jgi:thiamine biosynthesis lipoprotein
VKIRAAAVVGLLVVGCASRDVPLEAAGARTLVSDGRIAMGTVLEVSIVAPEGGEGRAREVIDGVFKRTAELEGRISSWDPASDVTRLNREAHLGHREVAREVSELLSQSLVYHTATRGTFDVTIGPLVDLWVEAARRGAPPSAEELALARQRVGSQHLIVSGDGRVRFDREGLSLNLGGIAKGYALDQRVGTLRHYGYRDALMSFGQSSTWALGSPPDADGWRLLVRGPGAPVLGVLTLRDQALSVSGSLGQAVTIGGVEYGHVLDPRTGMPLTERRQAVVVARSAALAEAFSKALLIGGPKEGIAIVEAQPGCEGLLADEDGTLVTTSGWQSAARFQRQGPGDASRAEPEVDAQVL